MDRRHKVRVRGEADPRLEMVVAYHTASTLAATNFYNKKTFSMQMRQLALLLLNISHFDKLVS